MDGVRKTYDGPLALARDLMVINVTKETIKVRMASVDEYVLPPDVTAGVQEGTSHRSKASVRGNLERQVERLHPTADAEKEVAAYCFGYRGFGFEFPIEGSLD